MTEANWRAQRRAALWEKLCSLAADLMEMTWDWEENDPEMASWDPVGISDTGQPARNHALRPNPARASGDTYERSLYRVITNQRPHPQPGSHESRPPPHQSSGLTQRALMRCRFGPWCAPKSPAGPLVPGDSGESGPIRVR